MKLNSDDVKLFYKLNWALLFKNSGEQKVYGVLGLQDNIRNVIPHALPQYVETILLPFRGKITYCGFIFGYNMLFEGFLKRGLQEDYKKIQRKSGIITSLDECVSGGKRK